MAPWIIWAAALAAYVLFRLWYDNWSGPLKPMEVEAFLAAIDGNDDVQNVFVGLAG